MSVFIMTDCLCCHLQQEYTAVLLAAVSIIGKYHRILRLCPSLLFVHASIGKSEEGAYVRDHYIYCFMGSTFYSLGGGGLIRETKLRTYAGTELRVQGGVIVGFYGTCVM